MDVITMLRLLRRFRWMMAVVFVALLGSTAVLTLRQRPTFQAIATMVIWPEKTMTNINDVVDSLGTLDRRVVVATYAKIPVSRTIQTRAKAQLQLDPRQQVSYTVRTAIVPDTNIIQVIVEGPEPRLCAELANAVADHAKRYIDESFGLFGFNPLDAAVPPLRPIRPDVPRNLSLGALLGLLLGVGLVFLIEYLKQVRRLGLERPASAPELERELSSLSR